MAHGDLTAKQTLRVPPKILDLLRESAEKERRSLNGQIVHILEVHLSRAGEWVRLSPEQVTALSARAVREHRTLAELVGVLLDEELDRSGEWLREELPAGPGRYSNERLG